MKEALAELVKLFAIAFFLSVMILTCEMNAALSAEGRATIEKQVRTIANVYNVDPNLVLAIIEVESGFNPNAKGALGEIGLMQLRPEFHAVIPGDTAHNLTIGIRYLAYVRRICLPHYGSAWFVCTNTGPFREQKLDRPTEFPYYRKVMKALNQRRVEIAANAQ